MSISTIFANQLRKPTGFLGKLFGLLMNKANRHLNDVMAELLEISLDDHILEIGFGNGQLLRQMASHTSNGKVTGVDFSETMVALAKKRNLPLLEKGLIDIHQASIEKLPFDGASFDKVCSANTIYFWPKPEENIHEILRVLKPGGKLVLGFRTKEQMQDMPFSKHGFTLYSENELVDLVEKSGFNHIEVIKKTCKKLDSYCLVAIKE